MKDLETAVVDSLFENGFDSLRHALDHFQQLGNKESEWHNLKWAVISTDHFLLCISNALVIMKRLHELNKEGNIILSNTKSCLNKIYPNNEDIVYPEEYFFGLGFELNKVRNELLHRIPESDLKSKLSSMSVIIAGVLRLLERHETRARTFIYEHREELINLLEFLKLDEHINFSKRMENLLKNTDNYYLFDDCPNCGSSTLLDTECMTCYKDHIEQVCIRCGEYFIDESSELCNNCYHHSCKLD